MEDEIEKILIASRIQTPDGTILWSRFGHDYVSYVDENGELYMLDGGNDYVRTTVNNEPAKNISIYDDVNWDIQRQYRLRGTFDRDGNRVWVPLCKLSNDHLEAILEYNKENCKPLSNIEIMAEIEYREENGIFIPDHDYKNEGVESITKQ